MPPWSESWEANDPDLSCLMENSPDPAAPAKASEAGAFFLQFLSGSASVGALCPSSRYLAELIVREAGVDQARQVVEIGSGSGAFTHAILRQCAPETQVVLVEQNAVFAGMLRKKFPETTVVEDCASRLGMHLTAHGTGPACSIVSGIPWASLPADLRTRLLDAIVDNLAAGGIFTTFAYFGPHLLPKGRAFRHDLQSRFKRVSTSRVEVRNLPPAFVYRAER